MSCEVEPLINHPCTSQRQKWGQGSKRVARDPIQFHEKNYDKKGKSSAYINIDPRPDHLRKTTKQELNDFHISHQSFKSPPNWLSVITLHYDDYEVDDSRRSVLRELRDQFIQSLGMTIDKYMDDHLSNEHSVHVSGTDAQANCDLWFTERKLRVTASNFLEFSKNPKDILKKKLLNKQPDLSRVPAIKWGRDHEKDALKAYEDLFGKTTPCGLFVSRKYPFLGASPDAIHDDCLIEIKCPYVLRDFLPTDLGKLKSSQKSAFPCELIGSELVLKRKHNYFGQVLCQMLVTGFKKTRFVV